MTILLNPYIVAPAAPPPDPGDAAEVTTLTVEGTGAASGHIVRFGQLFADGDMPTGTDMVLRQTSDDTAWRTQFTEKSYWPSGDVRWALIEAELPEIDDEDTVGLTLWKNDTHASPGSNINLSAALTTRTIVLNYVAGAGTPYSLDAIALLPAERWVAGPLVAEARVEEVAAEDAVGVTSLRLILDVSLCKNGDLFVFLALRNDSFDWPDSTGGDVTDLDFSLEIDGVEVIAGSGVTLNRYCSFIRKAGMKSGGGAADNWPAFVRPNSGYFADAGGPRYDFENGYDTSYATTWAAERASAGWNDVLVETDTDEVRNIPANHDLTGGRADVAPLSEATAAWIIDGNRHAQVYTCDQAEAAALAPWSAWDADSGRYLNREDRPGFRAHSSNGSFTPAEGSSLTTAGYAHATATMIGPAVLRGDRAYLNTLQGKAAFSVQRLYNTSLPIGPGAEAVRETAWGLRDLVWAAVLTPADDPMGSYFADQAQDSFDWLGSQVATFTAEQGSAHYGYLFGVYDGDIILVPWQQCYLASSTGLAARFGFDVTDWATFTRHFWTAALAASTTSTLDAGYGGGTTAGFPILTTGYRWRVMSTPGTYLTTSQAISDASVNWAEMGEQTAANQDGVYVRLAHVALHSLSDALPGDSDLATALATIETTHTSGASAANFYADPKHSIVKSGFTRA